MPSLQLANEASEATESVTAQHNGGKLELPVPPQPPLPSQQASLANGVAQSMDQWQFPPVPPQPTSSAQQTLAEAHPWRSSTTVQQSQFGPATPPATNHIGNAPYEEPCSPP